MTRTVDRAEAGEAGAACIRPMDPLMASGLRQICTMLRFHRGCPFKICRRAKACATRHVVCYQSMEEEIRPIVRSILARQWRERVEAGENPDIAPARRDGWIRLLAWEEAEIPRLLGRSGGGALTPYEKWLRNWVGDEKRPAARKAGLPEPGAFWDPDERDNASRAGRTPPKAVRRP